MISKFELSDNEITSSMDFREKHRKLCKNPSFSYIFSPMGIGVGKEIRCSRCGEVLDITDYGSW